ncbi:MAG: ATP-dependent helicase [Candidatus Magasanikbacteria bacterium]
MSINYQKELNSEQLDVVIHGDGPCLVLAGAGSGKTRTIIYRVAYLLEQGIKPENILLVTFTNRAAKEMVERLDSLVGTGVQLPWAGTFHSIANKILRRHARELGLPGEAGAKTGYQSNFTILDEDDAESFIKIASKEHAPESAGKNRGGGNKFPSSKVVKAIISFARNAQIKVGEAIERKFGAQEMWADEITLIARDYDKKKREANAMDFDDLLTNFLFLVSGAVGKTFSQQFQYILVDEYQDTNKIQAAIIKELSRAHNNVLAVGDDAQSIYSFRAADIENILNFEKTYPKAKIFKLTTNYRSSQEILSLANAVIANNPKQYKKNLNTILKTGVKPELHPKGDQGEEAEFIASKVESLLRGGLECPDVAVLFRAAHHSQRLEMELLKCGIDYDYRGGLRFFERSHVKDALAYLRILNNLEDTIAWMRVLMFEEGIGPGTAGKIIDMVKQFVILSVAKDPSNSKQEGILRFAQNDIAGKLSDKARGGWQNFMNIFSALSEIGKSRPAELVRAIIDSPYRNYVEAQWTDASSRLDDIRQLAIFAGKFSSLEEFLGEAALQEAFHLKNQKDKAAKAKAGKIVLSTIHQAKGLEWKAVFIIGLTDGGFPHERAMSEEGGLEEERRLFYVAVTRAKKYLYLTYPMSKGGGSSYGGLASRSYNNSNWGESFASAPSMFLGEVDEALLNDKSLLINPSTALNQELTYEPDDPAYVLQSEATAGKPIKLKPGSFLRSVEDL